jgi:dipeptidyl-peptidase-4
MRVPACLVVLVVALTSCAPQQVVRSRPAPEAAMPTRPESDRNESLHPSPSDTPVASEADREVLRALAQTRNFRLGAPEQATVTPDGKAVLFLRSAARDPKQSLFEMDVATGTVRMLAAPDAVLAGPETLSPEERALRERMRVHTTGFTSLDLDSTGSRALVTLSGRVFIVERATGKAHALPTGDGATIDPRFSPDGSRVAFVRDADLHVVPVAGGQPVRVTHGGSDHLTHGLAEFIAAEELFRTRGFWWSPDGTHILYEEADTSKVDVLTIADPFHPDKPAQRIAYPRPGRPNAALRFGVVAASGGPTTWAQWDHARFPYVAHASWPKGGPPLLFVQDRLQREGQLLSVDPATGRTTLLVEEHDPAWVNVDPSVPRWLPDGKGFLWSSERSGEWQLELRDAAGKLVRALTPKGFGYVSVADVDEARRTAVVVAGDDPTQRAPWLVSLDANDPPRRLGTDGRVITPRFEGSHAVYVGVEESLSAMPRAVVRSLDGAVEREIPSLTEAPRALPGVEIEEVGPDRVRVAIVRPRTFRADRRYPVVDAAYGGPHHLVVQRSVLGFLRAQWMADATQAIVVAMDARGTPRRGREWERAIHKQLGSVPLEGHVATLRELAASHPEMDATRIGVYGWSFGGYFAALAVLARPDVYRVGVAGAPPGDWRDYDTAYTERYLGLPDEDAAAYDAASVLTYARKPPARSDDMRPLFVMHGTADDNVWFTNSLKIGDALARARRPFELLPLVGTTHMLLEPELSEAAWQRAAAVLRDGLRARD